MSNRYPKGRSSAAIALPSGYPDGSRRPSHVPYNGNRRTYPRVRPLLPVARNYYKPAAWPSPGVKPRPSYVPSPTVPSVPGSWLTRFQRVAPWVSLALAAYWLYHRLPQRTLNSDAVRYCSNYNPADYPGPVYYRFNSTPNGLCTSATPPVPNVYAPGVPWLHERLGGQTSPGGQPLTWGRRELWFDRPAPAGFPGVDWWPGWVIPPVIDPIPKWLIPTPYHPPYWTEPPPVPPPVWRRVPDPRRRRSEDVDLPPEDINNPDPRGEPKGRVEFDPRGREKDEPKPWKRPKPRVRERKVRFRSDAVARRILGLILSGYSEFNDFIDALYKGVPKHLRTKNADTAQKIADMYNAGDEYNFVLGLTELWNNHHEDRIIGRGMAEASKILDDYGIELPFLKDGYTYLIR